MSKLQKELCRTLTNFEVIRDANFRFRKFAYENDNENENLPSRGCHFECSEKSRKVTW